MKKGNEYPSERVKRLRKSIGRTQSEIAAYLQCDPRTYGDWERGERRISDTGFLEKLADLYHVSTDYLLCRTNDINIGNAEITAAIGLSETSIEVLRFLNAPFSVKGNMQEYHQDTICFLNRALEAAAPATARTGEPFPVETIFSEMEKYVESDSVAVVHADGKETKSVTFRDGRKLRIESARQLYCEAVMTMIRKELDYLREEARNNG